MAACEAAQEGGGERQGKKTALCPRRGAADAGHGGRGCGLQPSSEARWQLAAVPGGSMWTPSDWVGGERAKQLPPRLPPPRLRRQASPRQRRAQAAAAGWPAGSDPGKRSWEAGLRLAVRQQQLGGGYAGAARSCTFVGSETARRRAPALQRYIREAQLPPEGQSPADRPAHRTAASDSSSASAGQKQRGGARPQQAQQAQQAQHAEQPQHVLPVVTPSDAAPNLYLQQRSGGSPEDSGPTQPPQAGGGGALLWPSASRPASGWRRPAPASGQRPGVAIAAAIAAEMESEQAATAAGRKRGRPPKAASAAAAAAATAAGEQRAAGHSSAQERQGSRGSSSAKVRLHLGSRSRQQQADSDEEGEEEETPRLQARSRGRRHAAPLPAAPQLLGGGASLPHGPSMVLLSQLHAAPPVDAAGGSLPRRRQGPAQAQQVQAALQALEQAPRSPVLSPLQILMLDQGSGSRQRQGQSPLPLPSVGMVPLLQLPASAALAPGQTPLAAALLPADLEELLDSGDGTLESLLFPASPLLPSAASLTPVVRLPGMAGGTPTTGASSSRPQTGLPGVAVQRTPPVQALAAVPLQALTAAGRCGTAAGGGQAAAGGAAGQGPPAVRQEQQEAHQPGPPPGASGTPLPLQLPSLGTPCFASPSMALLSPGGVEQWLFGGSPTWPR